MPGIQMLSGLGLPDYPCKCGNIQFMGDDWPNCSKCGEALTPEILSAIWREYSKWWDETFDFSINELIDDA
jgi:hypothetical protein